MFASPYRATVCALTVKIDVKISYCKVQNVILVYLQDSEFPADSRVNPQLAYHRGPSAHLTRSGGFRLTHTISAHNLPVSG